MSSSNVIESTEVNSGGVISITVNCTTCESEPPAPSETVKLMTCVPTWVGVGVHSNSPVFVSNAVPDMVMPLYEYSSVFVGMSSSWTCIIKDSFWFVSASISTMLSSSSAGATGVSPTPVMLGGWFTSSTCMVIDVVTVLPARSSAVSSTS